VLVGAHSTVVALHGQLAAVPDEKARQRTDAIRFGEHPVETPRVERSIRVRGGANDVGEGPCEAAVAIGDDGGADPESDTKEDEPDDDDPYDADSAVMDIVLLR
jgi:hypothetical protein